MQKHKIQKYENIKYKQFHISGEQTKTASLAFCKASIQIQITDTSTSAEKTVTDTDTDA